MGNLPLRQPIPYLPRMSPAASAQEAGGQLWGGSGEHLGQLDEIAEGIAEEGEAPADRGQLERLGHDGDAARAERLDGRVDAGHGQAEMMVAGPFQAVAEVGIGADILRGRIAAAQDLDMEVVV